MNLELFILPERLAVCQLPADAPMPLPISPSGIFNVTRASDELSIVCAESDAPAGARIAPGWRALMLRGPFDFGLTGILAAVLNPLAAAGVGIFALSTYNTDYVLVREAQLDAARIALELAGHRVTEAIRDD